MTDNQFPDNSICASCGSKYKDHFTDDNTWKFRHLFYPKPLSRFGDEQVDTDVYETYTNEELENERTRLNIELQKNSDTQKRLMHNIRNISFVTKVKKE